MFENVKGEREIDGIRIVVRSFDVGQTPAGSTLVKVNMEAFTQKGKQIPVDPDQQFVNPPFLRGRWDVELFWREMMEVVRAKL